MWTYFNIVDEHETISIMNVHESSYPKVNCVDAYDHLMFKADIRHIFFQ